MEKRVLVTGGLGYLGSILCEHLLAAGHRVQAVDNLMYGVGQQGLFHLCANRAFDFVKGDVRDEALMTRAGRAAPTSSSIWPPSWAPPPATATHCWPPPSTWTRFACFPACAARGSW